MIERVKDFIRAQNLIESTDRLLLGVSGGVDSMVLLHVLKELGYDISVAHVNYQLRDQDSELDEKLVEEFCQSIGVPFYSKRVKLTRSKSIQMEAREVRYDYFRELSKEHSLNKIVTAHHLNDSFETVLLNLTKGTGSAGLIGIASKKDGVVRPMLSVSKKDIIQFAREEQLVWREDSSNLELKYQRNLIRNKVIPNLEEINPSLLKTYGSSKERFLGLHELMLAEVESIKEKYLEEQPSIELSLDWMGHMAKDLMLLSELLKEYGVSYSLAKEIFLCKQSGKRFETETHIVHLDRRKLLVEEVFSNSEEEVVISDCGDYQWGNSIVTVDKTEIEEFNRTSISSVAFIDGDKIEFPLLIRSWKDGDSFKPLGMKGNKKLSDFFVDEKVPLSKKNKIPLIVHKDRIVWVGGYRLDDRFKVESATSQAIRIILKT